MNKSKFLGEFEIVVMAALMQLGDDAYGVSIIQEIEKRTGRVVTVGALYSTLSRLENKKYVRARMGEATSVRGGRAKKHFDITAPGRKQFEKSVEAMQQMLDGLPIGLNGASI